MRKFTLLFGLFGLLLSIVHYFAHDAHPVYLLFYSLSIPAWFWPVFMNTGRVHPVDLLILYTLTTLSWALIGYVVDRFSHRTYANNSESE